MISPLIIPTSQDYGYNPSLIEFNGKRMISYRYHPKPDEWRTQMMIGVERDGLMLEKKLKVGDIYADMSHEDGRFFMFNGKLHISLTLAVFPGVVGALTPCVQAYGELVEKPDCWQLEKLVLPKVGNNNFQTQEKNWLMFEYDGKLHVIYQCSPEQIIYRLGDGCNVDEVYRTESPSWEHGELRGGTQPLSFQGKWLRFFHSLHRHGQNRLDWSYAIGACVMQSEPPFKIEKISRFPIYSGDERYVPDWRFVKPNVAICYGAIPSVDGWDVGVGLNDAFSAIIHVKEENLNL